MPQEMFTYERLRVQIESLFKMKEPCGIIIPFDLPGKHFAFVIENPLPSEGDVVLNVALIDYGEDVDLIDTTAKPYTAETNRFVTSTGGTRRVGRLFKVGDQLSVEDKDSPEGIEVVACLNSLPFKQSEQQDIYRLMRQIYMTLEEHGVDIVNRALVGISVQAQQGARKAYELLLQVLR
jgi:hypothetical protein